MSKEVKRYSPLTGLARNAKLRRMEMQCNPQWVLDLAAERDALLAERDALKKALDRQVPLHDAIQRAAGDLPEGWEIRLCVEHHAGWVELIGPDGSEDFATNNERLDYTVIDALEHALQGEQP